jgi:hypothetical protein
MAKRNKKKGDRSWTRTKKKRYPKRRSKWSLCENYYKDPCKSERRTTRKTTGKS